jgi:hypothetical protein
MTTWVFRIFLVGAFVFFWVRPCTAGCIDHVWVQVKPVQCFGLRNGEIHIKEVVGGNAPYWYSLNDSTIKTTRPVFDLLHPGSYVLFVRDADGCLWSDTIVVPEPELLQVKLLAAQSSVESGEPVFLEAQVAPENTAWQSIEWRPPALFADPNVLTQTIYPSESTAVAVIFQDSNGCTARDQVEIAVEKTAVFFPNIIQPGSQQNAYFTVFAGEGVARVVSLEVYDRTGGLVFRRSDFLPNDPISGWNGRYRGRPVQPGSFVWLTVLEFLDGRREQFAGSVSVVR